MQHDGVESLQSDRVAEREMPLLIIGRDRSDFILLLLLHCTLNLVAQLIVFGPVCVRVCNGRAACVYVCVCGSVIA